MTARRYVGRFAPSPSGPLHFGSLVAALASFLDARSQNGRWLLRMDDLDTRARDRTAEQILRDLEKLHLEWDGPVIYQSRRIDLYAASFKALMDSRCLYPCACSRKTVGERYNGRCAGGLGPGQVARSWRLRIASDSEIAFHDRIQGTFKQNVHDAVGDFIVRRADGPFAYQLTTVVDDAECSVTDVVRGADLLDNVPRQMYLQQCLNLARLAYAHVPIATDIEGRKLSKSEGAAALNMNAPEMEIWRAFSFLGHQPPSELEGAGVGALLAWGRSAWSTARIRQSKMMNAGAE